MTPQLRLAVKSATKGQARRRRALIRILTKRRVDFETTAAIYYLRLGTVPRSLWSD